MKFLRIGKAGQEIPVALDRNGKYRNLSSIIKDLNSDTINKFREPGRGKSK
jgi:hypothetical protein